MANMINYGIDLGTTNSLIAKFNKGVVEVLRNPNGFKDTLPSVVAFRNDRILLGDQARTYAERDPLSVGSRFKRKMGTTESLPIKSLGQLKTPTELSALVLQELKTFVQTGEVLESVVITIPACFDMPQRIATEEAAHKAGFKQVVLLNEPIAASLAYANKEKNIDLNNSQWIVYDLGGGTFDVALVRIVEGELKVVDHEGDNFLGGSDFDALIVEKLITPQLEKRGKFTDLLAEMKSANGKYNRLWHTLLHLAEDAKIELSNRSSAEIDLGLRNVEDENGKAITDAIQITRSEFEGLIKDSVDRTAEMLRTILTRNSLRPQDLKFVLMVGGQTYTPFVRERIKELLGIPINFGSIDPTNAIAVGAAYFAATKEVGASEKTVAKSNTATALKIRVACKAASQEKDELFAAKVEGDTAGMFYRIKREDGGFDTGLKKLEARISEDLPLQADSYNIFSFSVFDAKNNLVPTGVDSIQIAQGKYGVAGQMLPHDICLVTDDLSTGDTKLRTLYARNTLTGLKKTSVEASRTILKGSDDVIRIMVVEGAANAHASANTPIGILEITGKQLTRDVHKGTSIDLTFDMSESQILKVGAHLDATGQDFADVFTPNYRNVSIKTLQAEIQALDKRIESEIDDAEANKNTEVVGELIALRSVVEELQGQSMLLVIDDTTDARYQLDGQKRKVAQQVHALTAGKHMDRLKSEYQELKREVIQVVSEHGNDKERYQLNEVFALEHTFITSSNPQKITEYISRLRRISFQVLRRTPEFLTGWFEHLQTKRSTFNDPVQAKSLIEAGKRHIAEQDYDHLAEVNMRLNDLLPHSEQTDPKTLPFITGIN